MENLAAANPTACRFGVLGVLARQQRGDSPAGGRSGPVWVQTDCAGEVNVRVAACTWDGALYLWQTSPLYRVQVLLCSTKIKENFSAESGEQDISLPLSSASQWPKCEGFLHTHVVSSLRGQPLIPAQRTCERASSPAHPKPTTFAACMWMVFSACMRWGWYAQWMCLHF